MRIAISSIGLICWILSVQALHAQSFFDDFTEKKLDGSSWKKVNKKWGENVLKGTHGGVIPENVFIKDGNLVIRAHGDGYTGNIWGHGQQTKVGGAVFSRKKFASGRYEIRAKICPQVGALSAFWTYHYESDTCNHEIDFEFPGHNQPPNRPETSDITWGLMTNWRGVSDAMHRNADVYFGNQQDGQYHLYRFEWHTGGEGIKPSVSWYYDDRLMHTSYEMIPTIASELWLGVWFPNWIGQANFAVDYMYIDWVKITEYHEPADK